MMCVLVHYNLHDTKKKPSYKMRGQFIKEFVFHESSFLKIEFEFYRLMKENHQKNLLNKNQSQIAEEQYDPKTLHLKWKPKREAATGPSQREQFRMIYSLLLLILVQLLSRKRRRQLQILLVTASELLYRNRSHQ